jgi:hypothetical protein
MQLFHRPRRACLPRVMRACMLCPTTSTTRLKCIGWALTYTSVRVWSDEERAITSILYLAFRCRPGGERRCKWWTGEGVAFYTQMSHTKQRGHNSRTHDESPQLAKFAEVGSCMQLRSASRSRLWLHEQCEVRVYPPHRCSTSPHRAATRRGSPWLALSSEELTSRVTDLTMLVNQIRIFTQETGIGLCRESWGRRKRRVARPTRRSWPAVLKRCAQATGRGGPVT